MAIVDQVGMFKDVAVPADTVLEDLIVPESARRPIRMSPRLAHPEQARDFEMEVSDEPDGMTFQAPPDRLHP